MNPEEDPPIDEGGDELPGEEGGDEEPIENETPNNSAARAEKIRHLGKLNTDLTRLKYTIIRTQNISHKISFICEMMIKMEEINRQQYDLLAEINDSLAQ